MKPIRSGPSAILLSVVVAVLIMLSAGFVVTLAVVLADPSRAGTEPLVLWLVTALTLGPSVMLAVAARRARRVAIAWDLGKTGASVLGFISLLLAAILGIAGMYPVVRLMQLNSN